MAITLASMETERLKHNASNVMHGGGIHAVVNNRQELFQQEQPSEIRDILTNPQISLLEEMFFSSVHWETLFY